MKIAFDVDDTLIIPSVVTGDRDTPNYDTIVIYKWFQSQGHTMIIWSGSGIDWAKAWNEKLGLKCDEVRVKQKSEDIDICFDDCDVDLAKVNVKVKRIANKEECKIVDQGKPIEALQCYCENTPPCKNFPNWKLPSERKENWRDRIKSWIYYGDTCINCGYEERCCKTCTVCEGKSPEDKQWVEVSS